MSKYMQSDMLKMIYYALFHIIISYGNIAWGRAYKNKLDLLQKAQKIILRIVNKNNLDQDSPLNLKQIFATPLISKEYTKRLEV